MCMVFRMFLFQETNISNLFKFIFLLLLIIKLIDLIGFLLVYVPGVHWMPLCCTGFVTLDMLYAMHGSLVCFISMNEVFIDKKYWN